MANRISLNSVHQKLCLKNNFPGHNFLAYFSYLVIASLHFKTQFSSQISEPEAGHTLRDFQMFRRTLSLSCSFSAFTNLKTTVLILEFRFCLERDLRIFPIDKLFVWAPSQCPQSEILLRCFQLPEDL